MSNLGYSNCVASPRHFAHYLKRRLVHFNYADPKHPWFSKHKTDGQGFSAPAYHITRSTSKPASEVVAGDTIWLLSQLDTPWGKLPPSLDARITVSQASPWKRKGKNDEENQQGLIFHAGEGSSWYPLWDASGLLEQMKIRLASGKAGPVLGNPPRHVGQALQSMREIANPKLLERHVHKLAARGFDFISYRLCDGTRLAHLHAESLAAKGRPFFWDRWSLPRGLAERREIKKRTFLAEYLEEMIGRSKRVWGIESPRYAEEKSYSKVERDLALKSGKLRMVHYSF